MRLITPVCLFFIAIACQGQQLATNAGVEMVFKDVNVIPMDRELVIEHQDVVIRDGRIQQVGNTGKVSYGKSAVIIAAAGKYLIPGLAEMHAHIPPVDDLEPMKRNLKLFAYNGITTIRGMLGHPRHLELRAAIDKGEIMGPHFYSTGPSFNGFSVTSPEQGAAMVRQQKAAGYDFLKMHPGLTRIEFDSIAAVANALKIPFAGHVSFGVGVWRAIDAGYSSIDHLDGFIEGLVPGIDKMNEQQAGTFGVLVTRQADESEMPVLMRALKDQNIWVVPTQSLAERWFNPEFTVDDFKKDPAAIYMSSDVTNQWIGAKNNFTSSPTYDPALVKDFIALRRRLILACQKNGIGLLLGCDAPQVFNVPGFSTHNELEYLVRAGLTPYEALATGTVNVARYLKIENAGVVKKDAVSDLVLLNGNPLRDIRETQNIAGVMLGTQWFSRAYLDKELKSLKIQ